MNEDGDKQMFDETSLKSEIENLEDLFNDSETASKEIVDPELYFSYRTEDEIESERRGNLERTESNANVRPVPKTGVALALFLTIAGAYLTIYGLLVYVGFCIPKHPDGNWAKVTLGLLTFIPGVYHVRLALFAYLGVPGFSFDEFPEFT